ncbi:MAG: archease [Deltaproteobacteria bacterium]|nr:archease [Deltaproteobacteria bacterium]
MGEPGEYRFLEHDADVGVAIRADDLESIWRLGARALCEVMTDPAAIRPLAELALEGSGPDLAAAWIESLGELLCRFEVDGLLLPHVDQVAVRQEGGEVRVTFRARGEPYDAARHPARAAVKAVTHHDAVLERAQGGGWRARALFDL